jgi:hypothetical protein
MENRSRKTELGGPDYILVNGSWFAVSRVGLVLDDFVECYNDEGEKISKKDLKEINRLRHAPRDLVKSYLFDKIKPFVLPFYRKGILLC